MPRAAAPSLVALLLLACVPKSTVAPPPEPTPPSAAAPEPAPPSVEPAPPLPACRVDPLPVAAPAPPPPAACAAVPAALRKRLGPALTREYKPTAPGAKAVVTFDCDPLAAPAELVHETGSGHGDLLQLTRLRWQGNRLVGLRMRQRGDLEVARVELPARSLGVDLAELRALALASLTEKVPDEAMGMSAYGSSHSWHAHVRLVDVAGRALERSFTGYDSSDTQIAAIPVAALDKRLDAALDKLNWQPAALDDDARAFFVDRYLAAGPAKAGWWIKEHLVQLAASAGTPALVPSLVALAQTTRSEASDLRTRTQALAALAVLAGFDARKTAEGAAVPEPEAAAVYARACAR